MASEGGPRDGNGAPAHDESTSGNREDPSAARRPTLNSESRRRRADRAFYLRLAAAIRQNERALERLKR